MAKQHTFMNFTRKLGNVIGYKRNGVFFLRAAPEVVRRTAASKLASKRFGEASKRAALIRRTFINMLDMGFDSSYINRLNSLLIKAAGNNIAGITGFKFNEQTDVNKFFSVTPTVSEDGTLHIPAQVLPTFKNITALEVNVIAARISFTTLQTINTETTTLTLNVQQPFNGIVHTPSVPGMGTLVVVLQVRGMFADGPSGDKRYQAADIVGVIVPPVPQKVPVQTHTTQRPSHSATTSAFPATTTKKQPALIQRE